MPELISKRSEYIRASASEVWRALTDPDLTQQYIGTRVQSTWQVGDEIRYVTADGNVMLEGTLLEVVPNRRLVYECRLLWEPRFAAEKPHRETFEIEDFGDVCKLSAVFDDYEPDSPSFAFACDSRGGMDLTGSSIKSLLETGSPLFLGAGAAPHAQAR